MKLKAEVLVVNDACAIGENKAIIVGEVINKAIDVDGCFALSDPDRKEPKIVYLSEIQKGGKSKRRANVGEIVNLTITGNIHARKGMVLSRRRMNVFDFIGKILANLP
jgi:F420-dependent methylenetetrahydromethanopterin dehydrogenase